METIVDADAHVVEARDLFTERLPSKYGNAIPHVRYRPDVQADWWFVGDTPIELAVGSVIIPDENGEAVRPEEFYVVGKEYAAQHPSSWDPNERVKVMDKLGVAAATTYPYLGLTGPDVWRETVKTVSFEFQMDVVRAYNDWIAWWGTEQPGRFIPLGCLPYWDVPSAVKEIERAASIGIRGMVMSGWPQIHGCPHLADPSWDPMWAAAQDARFSISFHSGGGGIDDMGRNKERHELVGRAMLSALAITSEFLKNALAGVDIITSGVLQKYPRLNFALAETGAGWVPFVLESLDVHYLRYRPWESREIFKSDELPSDLFRRQIFVTNWFENINEDMPLGNTMFETDYPHPTCLLAEDIHDAIKVKMGSLTDEQRENILWRNALRCFNVAPEEVGITPQADA